MEASIAWNRRVSFGDQDDDETPTTGSTSAELLAAALPSRVLPEALFAVAPLSCTPADVPTAAELVDSPVSEKTRSRTQTNA